MLLVQWEDNKVFALWILKSVHNVTLVYYFNNDLFGTDNVLPADL